VRSKKAQGNPEILAAIRSFLMGHWNGTLKLWGCVLVAFLVGHTLDIAYQNYESMDDKYQALLIENGRLKDSTAKLIGKVGSVSWGIETEGTIKTLVVIATVEIENPSGPPRSITGWDMSLSSHGEEFPGHYYYLHTNGDLKMPYKNSRASISFRHDYFCPLSMEPVIASGESRQCWFVYAFYGKNLDFIKSNPVPMVRFRDVLTGETHSIFGPPLGESPDPPQFIQVQRK
jgi:hypothetical protein